MSLRCEVSSFKYTDRRENWETEIFLPLLMRHGGPPKGVKYYGKQKRLHLTSPEAKSWSHHIAADCNKAVQDSVIVSHYKPHWKSTRALHLKNLFIRWCRDNNDR